MSADTGIDKQALYGEHLAFERDKQDIAIDFARQKLHLKAVRKSLDMADDEMNIDASRHEVHHHHAPPSVQISKPGLGPLGAGLLAAALATGASGLGLGLWSALRQPATQIVEKVLRGDADVTAGEPIVTPPK